MGAPIDAPAFADVVGGVHRVVDHCVSVATWYGGAYEHRSGATAFVMTAESACLTVAHGTYALPRSSYAVLPDPARVEGGSGVVVTHQGFRGLFHVGGPVEPTGRLRYIDGCSDTVLVAPVVRGDPCLNLLHLPAGTRQASHQHPSVRIGLVVSGRGTCTFSGRMWNGGEHDRVEPLRPASVFVLPPGAVHRFETDADDDLLLFAWHPDSESGPTDDDHPMLNRTLRPGAAVRVR